MQHIMQQVLMVIFLLLHAELGVVFTFEPVSTVTAVTGAFVSVGFAGFKFLHCRFQECCDDRWIPANVTGDLLFTTLRVTN